MKITMNVKWNDGVWPIECELAEHPTKYGNGTCVGMVGRPLPFGKVFYDTRYIDFEDFGGFEGFCKEQLKAKGFELA